MSSLIRKSPWGIALALGLFLYALLSYWQGQLETDRHRLNEDINRIMTRSENVPYGTSSKVNNNFNLVYFSSIIYIDKDHWTVWVNGQTYRPESPSFLEEYAPITIHEEGLELTHGTDTLFLRPDQTYDPHQKHVFNGDKRARETPSG